MNESTATLPARSAHHQSLWIGTIALIAGLSIGYAFVIVQTPDAFGSAYECTKDGGPNHPME